MNLVSDLNPFDESGVKSCTCFTMFVQATGLVFAIVGFALAWAGGAANPGGAASVRRAWGGAGIAGLVMDPSNAFNFEASVSSSTHRITAAHAPQTVTPLGSPSLRNP